jgi:hypothetical protein
VWPKSSTVRFNQAVGIVAQDFTLNCCNGSESENNQENLHVDLESGTKLMKLIKTSPNL